MFNLKHWTHLINHNLIRFCLYFSIAAVSGYIQHKKRRVGYRMSSMSISEKIAVLSWWRHQMETFSALLASCAGNSPVPGEFPTQRPVTRSFDIFFDLSLNKRLSKQSWGWWFETLSSPLWRHCNGWNTKWQDAVHWVTPYRYFVFALKLSLWCQ